MIQINYPIADFKVKKEGDKEYIFDSIRKQWLKLTPEEWVRQNFISYLLEVKKYPASLIAIEKEISLGDIKKRCDIIIYKKEKPWMIVECKEMNIELSEKVITQILNYNQSLRVDFLIITNGNKTFGIETSTQINLESLPDYF